VTGKIRGVVLAGTALFAGCAERRCLGGDGVYDLPDQTGDLRSGTGGAVGLTETSFRSGDDVVIASLD